MIPLAGLEIVLAHEAAFVMFIYIAILGIAYGSAWALPAAAVLTAIALFLPPAIPSWHATFDPTTAASLALVSLAMWAFFGIIRTNHELQEARAEVATLAAEAERNRIARDLHDLLGHSLTTITVKAGLAKRLADHDPARAAAEIGEVEELARRSLSDVRAAVSNYRIVTLATELATAQEVMRAGGIDARAVADRRGRRRSPGAVRLGGTRSNDERRAALARDHVHGDARPAIDRDRRQRVRRWRLGLGQRHQRPARAGGAGGRGGRGGRGPGRRLAARGERAVTIRLLVADDQALIRSALVALLSLEDGFEVVAEVGRGDEVVAAVTEHRPDVALLDIEMPGLDGLAAAAALATQAPACRVLILTTFGRTGYLRRAMEAGVLGFVVKDAPAEQLADAVRRVAAGERVVDPELAAATLAGGPSPLTGRERDVLVAARDGATVADISARLFLSEGTVRNYLSSAISKTGARNRLEAIKEAEARGWL